MTKFTDEDLAQLEMVLPNYSHSLCEKAFVLAIESVGNTTKEEFLNYVMSFLELLKIDIDPKKSDAVLAMASNIQPMSKIFRDLNTAKKYLEETETLLPQDHPFRLLNLDNKDKDAPKAVFAAAIFALITILTAKEEALADQDIPERDRTKALDTISEHIRLMYEQLLYFDSEIENIENRQSKRKAAAKSNDRHTSLHRDFVAFYEANKLQWSKRECARRFYETLPGDQKRLYTSIEHAQRQLTDALRAHLKRL